MRSFFRILGVLCLLASAGLLAAWTIGKVVSDRWVWSQYLSWIPSVLAIPVSGVFWLQGTWMTMASGQRSRVDRVLRTAVEVWVLLAAGYWGLVECRVYRFSTGARPQVPHLRVLSWNVNEIQKMPPIAAAMLPLRPDVAFLVNPHSYGGWSHAPEVFGADYQYTNIGGMVVLSRVRVLRYGMMWLGLEPPVSESPDGIKHAAWVDPGRAMYVELDTKAQLGRTSVVWVVDLPSKPGLSRWDLALRAAKRLREWKGPELGPAAGAVQGFPSPDLILGDFNIPRGSASLALIAPGMTNAFDEAGTGYGATWPRLGYRTPIPLLQIDQTFVGARLRTARYEVVEPGFGYHRLQVGDYVAR